MIKKLLSGVFLSLIGTTSTVVAAEYPTSPIQLVIPFAAGGNTDIAGRLIGKGLSEELGQPVVIENKAGAGTKIASAYVAKSKPDGYTLLFTTIALAVNPHLDKTPSYDYKTDFAPVAKVVLNPLFLTVNPSVPASNLQEFIVWLKANKQTPYGSAGSGSAMHLAGEAFRQSSGTDVMHVPYGGESKVLIDLISGQVKFAFTGASASLDFIKNGKLKAIAYTGPERSVLMPGLATAQEQGLKGFVAYTWGVVLAPKGTPEPIINKLNQALNKAISKKEIQEKLVALGFEPVMDSTPLSTDAFIVDETKKWGSVVNNASLGK